MMSSLQSEIKGLLNQSENADDFLVMRYSSGYISQHIPRLCEPLRHDQRLRVLVLDRHIP